MNIIMEKADNKLVDTLTSNQFILNQVTCSQREEKQFDDNL